MLKELLKNKLQKLYSNKYNIHTFDETFHLCLVPINTVLEYGNQSEIISEADIIIGCNDDESRVNIIKCKNNTASDVWVNILC